MRAEQIEGGFATPALDGQAAFRAIMDAMARPGTVRRPATLARPPLPLTPMAATVALALCDHDTPLWLDPVLRGAESVKAWLGVHTGAPRAHTPAEAHFALVADPAALIALENFAQGSQDYPDRSTTLILQVRQLGTEDGLTLTGPGIETAARLAPDAMPRHFVEQWRQNNARFPRGVDMILCAQDGLACLPRTTRIAAAEA